MSDPALRARARTALTIAARAITLFGLHSRPATRALQAAHHAVAAALEVGHHVTDIHTPLTKGTKQ